MKRIIYLDNAATSWPKPQRVLDEMARFICEEGGSPNRAGHRLAAAAGRVVDGVRGKLARLFNIDDPNRLIHCFNCTDALNMAIKGCLREGDHVITTALEHNSISRPLNAMARAGFITLTRLEVPGCGVIDPDSMREAIQPKTRLIATLHASNVTGAVQPIAAFGRIAREHDCLLLVDAAQSAGLLDIDVGAMNADMLAFPGHKALLGPTGTGGLYVGPRVSLRPWREGGTGGDSANPTQPEELPTWLEAGTHNTAGLAGLGTALDGLDPGDALNHNRSLAAHIIEIVAEVTGVRVIGNPRPLENVGVVSLCLEGKDPADVAASLDRKHAIAVRPGLHCAPYAHRALGTYPDGTVRVSVGASTTQEDIDALVWGLIEICSERAGSLQRVSSSSF